MHMVHLLLIEDNSADALILQDALTQDDSLASFKFTVAERLSEGLKQLSEQSFDLILLDLGLPDSQGLETLREINTGHPEVPIIVLTGLTDKEMAFSAVSHGAQDYLVKGQLSSGSIERVIRYAIERQRLQHQIIKIRQNEQQERELRSLAELAVPTTTSVTARTFGIKTIHEVSEEIFGELAEKYGRLLESAIEQRSYRVDNKISEQLRSLAMEVGILKGGARDIIELHTFVMNQKILKATHERSLAYVEEGRLLVLEIMGHLVTHYRSQARLDVK